jgi:STE24 endopeptidase
MQLFDPALATARLIDSLGAEALARSEAYTRGSNVLALAGIAVWVLVAVLAVRLRLMERLLGMFPRWRKGWATLFALTTFFVVIDLARLPWAVLADWFYPRSYGLTRQPLWDFVGQFELDSIVTALVAGLFFMAMFALIRRVGRRWWVSAGGIAAITVATVLVLGPPLLFPLFNTYRPVPQGPVRVELERIADRAGIAHDRLFLFDGSRQSDVFTANVGGLGPAARIAISDVALDRASLDEIKVVTAHEAGHYVLGHSAKRGLVLPVLAAIGLALIAWLYGPAARLMRCTAPIGDPAGLPVFVALIALLGFAASPVLNAISRHNEAAADHYALETTNLPDALASALLKTSDIRYPRPSLFEEALFYSHPSVEHRVRAAMEWKAAHLPAGERRAITPP